MKVHMRNILISYTGPSGAGKTTLANNLAQVVYAQNEVKITPVISHTTRPPRPGEVDGVHYYFISKECFHDGVEEWVEYVEFHGHFYGLSRTELERVWDKGAIPSVVLTPEGLTKVIEYCDKYKISFLPFYVNCDELTLISRYIERMSLGDGFNEYHAKRVLSIREEATEWPKLFHDILGNKRPSVYISEYKAGGEGVIHQNMSESIVQFLKIHKYKQLNTKYLSYSSYEEAAQDIYHWADATFPQRSFTIVQRKLTMCEIPELVLAIGAGDVNSITEEVADVLILLLDMCRLLNIDVLTALKTKMDINKSRSWTVDNFGVSQHVKE